MKIIKTPSFRTLFTCALIMPSLFANASALTATTTKTIQGLGPTLFADGSLVPADINDVLHFKVPDSSGFSTYYGNTSFTGVYFPKTLRIDEFDVDVWDNYIDSDGDTQSTTNWVTYTSLVPTWKDRNGNVPTSNANLDSCLAPYTLKIDVTNLQVHSEHGDPLGHTLGNLTKTFTIDVEPDVCFVKPPNMQWIIWTTPAGGPQLSSTDVNRVVPPANNSGGGWDVDQFDPTQGFFAKVSNDKFPTTGFIGASFDIIANPTTWAGGYSFSSATSSWYEVSSSGKVTLKQKPSTIPATGVVTVTPSG